MMPKIFVDTSAWYAIADPSDNNHQSALIYRNQIAKKYHLVISNYILDELYTLLLIHVNYNRAIEMKRKLDILEKRKILEVVWIDEKLSELAWQVFETFNQDKQWSFTDCTSYVIMQQLKIREAFTYDHHFSQMGFICYPKINR
jgi:predicted nucleic acid-binding protein